MYDIMNSYCLAILHEMFVENSLNESAVGYL